MGHSGLYRLVDASDTAGVLVQTADLPANGGAFTVKAKAAPGRPAGQLLTLAEIQRSPIDSRPRAPIAALVVSVLALLVLAVLAVRAIREQRRYLLALPLWLLPYARPTGKADRASDSLPALRYEPELEVADRRQHVRLRNRKRGLLTAMGGAAALTGLSALWVRSTRPTPAMIPTFVLLAADNSGSPGAPPEAQPLGPDSLVARADSGGDQTPTIRIAPPPPAPAVPRATVAVARKPVVKDSAPVRRSDPPPPAPPAARVTKPVPKPSAATTPQSSANGRAITGAPAKNPPPAPPPQPPPPPPPPRRRRRVRRLGALTMTALKRVRCFGAALRGSSRRSMPGRMPTSRSCFPKARLGMDSA